ncbi:outer membrane beta-barrel protein [Brevundimonas sp.]|uniref:outer membrane beta-barrel protein n=1 Tax=Brevundimonas sp. TaxID=1871086 RepID=UPI00289A9DEC|nr:outer membrane beta-barrel protein [Brevundimonas sp.]
MRFILSAVSAMAFLSTAGAVSAQTITDPQWTVSGGYAHVESTNAAYGALTARAAAKLHKNFGVEAEGSFGITEDIAQGIIFADDLKLKYDLAGYAVGYLPVTENFELFGRLGYGTTQVSRASRKEDCNPPLR